MQNHRQSTQIQRSHRDQSPHQVALRFSYVRISRTQRRLVYCYCSDVVLLDLQAQIDEGNQSYTQHVITSANSLTGSMPGTCYHVQ